MINHVNKYIFIHIPKCGGTSVEASLKFPNLSKDKKQTKPGFRKWDETNKIWLQHATANQIRTIYCNNFNEYFSFTFVRNPWSKLLSDYFWCKKELKINDTFKNFILLTNKFDTVRLSYPHIDKKGRGDHLLPQTDYILDTTGKELVNFIGRFEKLQQDFDIVCDKIGIPRQQLPHKNKTKHKHYTEYYDDETKEIVAERYAKDIEYFGYEFEK